MKLTKRIVSLLLALIMVINLIPMHAHAAEADAKLTASLAKAKSYIDGITINNSSNDPATVVKNFKTHFTWDNEKRENSKSYLFDWSYYNGVVFEGIEYLYEVTGETVYKDYVVEYMSSMITSAGGWATCTNNTSKQAAGYNSTHGADCYKTASLLMDCYQMTGDQRYLTMAKTLYADLDSAANSYSLKNAGYNYRHTWASDPSPDLWLDGLYMILPFRAEYAKYIGDTEELNLIVSRLQWVSDNMYNSSKGLFYHAADSASSNSGTYWLRSIGWYAAALVDVMDSMQGSNLEIMKVQLKKLVDGMKACQNTSNGMWLNNMNASQSSSNPYETSGTALVCYAVMKAVNNGWLDESYADMAILAFNGICNEKLSGSTLKDICFKGVPGSSNSTFYDNEGKGVGPFIMFYAEVLEYVNKAEEEPEVTEPEVTEPEVTEPEVTEPEVTEPEVTEPAPTEPEPTEPDPSEPEEEEAVYSGTGTIETYEEALGSAVSSITSGTSYYLVNTKASKTLTGTANGTRLVMNGTQSLDNTNRWYITQVSGNTYYVQYGGPTGKYLTVGNDSAAVTSTPTALTLTYDSTNSCWDIGSGNYHLNDYRAEHNYASGYTAGSSSDNGSRWAFYPVVAVAPTAEYVLDTDGINSGEKYIIVYSGKALQNNNGVDNNPAVTISNNTITLADDSAYGWTITQSGSNTYYVENNGSYLNLTASGNDPIGSQATVSITLSSSKYTFRNASGSGAYLRYSNSQLFCAGTNSSNTGMSLYRRTSSAAVSQVVFSLSPSATVVKPGSTLVLNGTVTVDGKAVSLNNCTIAWNSSNSGCATVSNGTVTGVAAGNATINVTLSAVNGTALKNSIVLTVPVTVQGHEYETVVTAPTCTEKGYTTYICTICGDSYVSDEIAALGHVYEAVVTAPTCTEAGFTTYTCHCGDTYVADEVAALGHTYESVTTDATCTENGSIVYTCHCGDTYTEVIPALGHNYESVVTAPTCTEAGFTTYTCHCGDTYIADEVPALGHSYESVTTDATCTENGSIVFTCRCGDTYTEVIPALGHNYESVVTAPTCTEVGFTTYTCHCGDTYIADEVPALGHVYEAVVTAPTCTKAGFTTYTCHCGDTHVADEVAALGHTYESVTTDATCTENGSIVYTCHCGDSYTEVIPALGHKYESVTTAPTCETVGYTTHTCACGHRYTSDEVAALGHDWNSVITEATCVAEGYTTHTCRVCGLVSVDTIVPALGHEYESKTTAATCTENGATVYTCHCGDTYTEEIPALGHQYETVVTVPTCTDNGYTTYTCHCGDSFVADEVAALGHAHQSVTTEATCTENGSIVYTCRCGDTYTEVIPALGHKYEAVVTAPTCEDAGYTTYTCACGESYIADEVAALGHKYEAVVTAPTCEDAGYTTYTCACGDSYIADEVAALGHKYEAVVTKPTCEDAGYTTYTCACGDSYIADEVAALGHKYEAVVTAPTCEDAGYTTYSCHCGDTYIADEVPALGHTYESVTTDATCTENGAIIYTCHCGDTYTEVIPALGHEYEAVVTDPTCTEIGYTTYACHCGDTYVADEVEALGHNYESVTTDATCTENGSIVYTCHCGDSYTEVIPALGHQYEAVVTAPTCTDDGYTTYTCHCGESYVADAVAALGHAHQSVTTEATCTENGAIVYTCHCGDSYTEVIPALGHKYETVVTAPTCTEAGFTTYTCHCGESYVADEIAALGHSYKTAVTEPTCEDAGYTTYTCVCGESYIADEVAALGHTYESVVTDPTCEDAGYTTYTCVCGDSYVADEVAAIGHDYQSVTHEATCTENGSVVYTCHCGDTYSEVIPAVGHKYESRITAPTCTETGFTTYTCHCGDTYVADETDALGHNYETVEQSGMLIHTCTDCGNSYTESVAWIALPKVYVLDTDGIDIGAEHKYLVVGVDKNYALTVSGTTVGSAGVTVSGNTISLDNASNYEFYFVSNNGVESGSYLLTKDGSKYVYHMGGNMYYGTDNKGYWHIGSSSNGSYQLYDYDNLNWYLNYGYVWGSDSVSRFAVSSTARSVRLFKAAETYARLSGDGVQTYTHEAGATVDTILSKLTIQLSKDGSNVSENLAVSSSMVSWDKSFESFTAGTYTGTVVYQGVVLGSVTVTITGEHSYETTETAATCTAGGAATHTCTACGHSYQDNITAALGHSYNCVEENGYFIYTCDRCGDSYSEKSISYTQVSAISAGNNYVITLYSGGTYYALSHANNAISVVNVTVSNGEITSEITEDLLWTYSNNKMSYVSNGTTYYMYCYTNSWWGGWWGNWGTSLQLSSSNSSTVSFSNNQLKVGSYYLKYSNGSVNLNSSATSTYVFIEG